ncbi:hypothetical protein L198_00656 [Cryptococcus wingfieldii CBS 7118]|uniref:Uncharacterized protein n=1 Tax=Cryptococcus wingfieldii CBS 7118 TaxID=1295528 RepID=A0A1E3K8R6_9TREE|nr:hypothetical protein L198_00656 [Cryptococcus wingfieldii CBS 7118]ODO08917.1 hypothetical protein L198_00656 [Cryptococcus wingfieldii CBS 7118]
MTHLVDNISERREARATTRESGCPEEVSFQLNVPNGERRRRTHCNHAPLEPTTPFFHLPFQSAPSTFPSNPPPPPSPTSPSVHDPTEVYLLSISSQSSSSSGEAEVSQR